MDFKQITDAQRRFFASGKTLSIPYRIEQLKKLKQLVQAQEQNIANALKNDLNKSPLESFLSEIYLVIDEINLVIKNLKKWSKPQTKATPFPLLWPGRSKVHSEPYGVVLIIAPWNYPFLLLMSPLIGAISAGNCAIIKPSEIATHTNDIITRLINENFPSEYLLSVTAGPEETGELLQQKFDYIFFTGGTAIGKIVMEAAAKHLTPVTLELGGKSPCIVDETADISFAARRIIWGKLMNAGQTCVAPDYLLVQQSVKEKLIAALQQVIVQFYGTDVEKSPSYGKIINKKHFTAISQLMQKGKIIYGGKTNENNLYIAPTLIDEVTWNDPIMQQEIFGPLLPILTFDKIEEVIASVNQHPKPLALYFFSRDKQRIQKVCTEISFGGGCINDCLLHLANLNLPFGGVGTSGMGSYHGKYSFDTFSHHKSLYRKTLPIDFNLQYPPYNERKYKWFRRLLNLF